MRMYSVWRKRILHAAVGLRVYVCNPLRYQVVSRWRMEQGGGFNNNSR